MNSVHGFSWYFDYLSRRNRCERTRFVHLCPYPVHSFVPLIESCRQPDAGCPILILEAPCTPSRRVSSPHRPTLASPKGLTKRSTAARASTARALTSITPTRLPIGSASKESFALISST